MSSNPVLRGMAWDHPRGVAPLRAISKAWRQERNVEVHWDARPLKDFEDQALEELADRYDLVLIDHPFTETAASSGLISPVNDWTSAAYLADQQENSVGPSYPSYTWNGQQWALAIDAATQVSASRPDLLREAGIDTLPRTWEETATLAETLVSGPYRVALPLNENHAYCAFLSVGVSLAGPDFWPAGRSVERATGREALGFLRALVRNLHPDSAHSDPIAISDQMATGGEIVYVPLMFGYSSYARPGFRDAPLVFGNAPTGPGGARGSVLGGVGLALSARSRQAELAADLARTISSPEMQAGMYVDSGGQPGHLQAWRSERANAQTGEFFARTLETMNSAFLRPRVSGHRAFQPLAGALVHRYIWGSDMSAGQCLDDFEQLCSSYLTDWR